MYHPIKVESLSPPQLSRLLNNHGVRLKLDNNGPITVHLTKQQHKKLTKAHMKGSGAVITLDPYQMANHQHLKTKKGRGTQGYSDAKGSSITRIEDQGVSSNDIANFLGAQQSSDPMADKQVTMNQVKDASKRIKNFLGMGMKKKGKGTRLEDQEFTVNDISNFLGAHQSSDPMADKPMTLNQVKDTGIRIKNFMGLGIKKRGRPKKLKGGDIFHDIAKAFKPAASFLIHEGIPTATGTIGGLAGSMMSGGPVGGMAGAVAGEEAGKLLANYVGNKTGLGINIGVGTGQKKRKNKSKKGSALYNAGYMK